MLLLSNNLRRTLATAYRQLRERGATAIFVAVDKAAVGVLPEDKANVVKRLQQDGAVVSNALRLRTARLQDE